MPIIALGSWHHLIAGVQGNNCHSQIDSKVALSVWKEQTGEDSFKENTKRGDVKKDTGWGEEWGKGLNPWSLLGAWLAAFLFRTGGKAL